MVKTLSTMLDLGTSAPDFILPDVVSGQTISSDTFSGNKALLVMFICRHCPFVKHIQQEIALIGRDYRNNCSSRFLRDNKRPRELALCTAVVHR
jgi:peroxiredoxin